MKLKTKGLVVALLIAAFALAFPAISLAGIQVNVDGNWLSLDQPPVMENGRTLVPLRAIFEALDTPLEWCGVSNVVSVNTEETQLRLPIGSKKVQLNGAEVELDVPGRVLQGRTLVPTRFIAQSLGATVDWEPSTKTVVVSTDPDKVPVIKPQPVPVVFNPNVYLSSNCDESHLRLEVKGNSLHLNARAPGNNHMIIVIRDESGNELFKNTFSGSSGVFSQSFSLPSAVRNARGPMTVSTFASPVRSGRYPGFIWGIAMHADGGQVAFPKTEVFDNNAAYIAKMGGPSATDLDLRGSQSERDVLRQKAAEITAGLSSDMEKLRAISTWVSENIYYDFDVLYGRAAIGRFDAYGVLESRRGVCDGYARLTVALLRSVDIPARRHVGFARGVGATQPWSQLDHSRSNHAWNSAFVDGRWVFVDTTWNSRNKFEHGQYETAAPSSSYFDITIEMLSQKHKLMQR